MNAPASEQLLQANTPEKVLRFIVDNEAYFGFDPYYREMREAMLAQAKKVLSSELSEKAAAMADELETHLSVVQAISDPTVSRSDARQFAQSTVPGLVESLRAYRAAVAQAEKFIGDPRIAVTSKAAQ